MAERQLHPSHDKSQSDPTTHTVGLDSDLAYLCMTEEGKTPDVGDDLAVVVTNVWDVSVRESKFENNKPLWPLPITWRCHVTVTVHGSTPVHQSAATTKALSHNTLCDG